MGYTSSLTAAVRNGIVTYHPTHRLSPGIVPHLIEIGERTIPALLSIEHGREEYDYHVVEYPSLESVGYYQRDEITVIGIIQNHI